MDNVFLAKQLEQLEQRFEEIGHQLQDPNVTSDQKKYRDLMREHSHASESVRVYREYKKLAQEFAASKEMLLKEKDPELLAMIKEELAELEPKIAPMEQALKILLLPKDPNDGKNIMLEIRAGAGGDEASLFAEQLFTAYNHYCNAQGWRTEVYSVSDGNVGGFKEVVANVTGENVFSRLKFESGVHRVQRVPKTETQGRVHTSTVTVAVLPEAEEVDVHLDPLDLRIDVYRSGGKGGQSVNTTDSAVRVTHIPTGLVVVCQDEKSQLKNKNKAMKILLARMKNAEEEKAIKEASDARLAQIGTGDRSERIRTYNFPQSRVTDHRIGLTVHQIDDIMKGNMDIVIDPLIAHFQTEALKQQQEQ